jgi:hypothetical protein
MALILSPLTDKTASSAIKRFTVVIYWGLKQARAFVFEDSSTLVYYLRVVMFRCLN